MCQGMTRCRECSSCGTTVPARGRTLLRCADYAVDPDRRVVGTNMGPTMVPTMRIVNAGNTIGYEQLFSEITPEGNASVYRNPGTFGTLVQAGRRL